MRYAIHWKISGKTATVLMLGIAAWVLTVQANAQVGCKATATDMLKSCEAEALSEYWLALGKAANISNRGERKQAIADAAAAYEEALDECEAQEDARLGLCSALGDGVYDPKIVPNDFANGPANPYFPLVPGTIRTYEGATEDGLETIVVTVTDDTREILGVECVVVRDTVYLDGEMIEDTLDYFANDAAGNVWYFGENTVEIEDGLIVNTEGAWIAGEDGAKPGIVMPAPPVFGVTYRQEFDLGNAEDAATDIGLGETVNVPAGTFTNCVRTADFTPISPDSLEHKSYAPGVGLVRELDPETGSVVALVSVTNP